MTPCRRPRRWFWLVRADRMRHPQPPRGLLRHVPPARWPGSTIRARRAPEDYTRMPTHSHRPLPKLPCGGLQEVRPDGAGTNSKNTHVFTGGQNESGVRWARNPHVERLPGPDPARPTRVELVRTGQAHTTWFAEDRISGSRRGPGPPAGSPRPSPYRASGSRSRRSRSSGRARPWPARWARPRRCGSGADPYRPG